MRLDAAVIEKVRNINYYAFSWAYELNNYVRNMVLRCRFCTLF